MGLWGCWAVGLGWELRVSLGLEPYGMGPGGWGAVGLWLRGWKPGMGACLEAWLEACLEAFLGACLGNAGGWEAGGQGARGRGQGAGAPTKGPKCVD